MIPRFVVTGTDTGVGKTIFSAALADALGAAYWKPVQAGLDGETDSEIVQRLAGLPEDRQLPEAYRLREPASPHLAAQREHTQIEAGALAVPETPYPLVIEGAGGLLAPLSWQVLQIDVFQSWGLPVILCARTTLGTINHTLLSLEALRRRGIPVHGVAFIGDANPEVEATIMEFGGAKRLGRLPWIDPLSPETLREAFSCGFDMADFLGERQ